MTQTTDSGAEVDNLRSPSANVASTELLFHIDGAVKSVGVYRVITANLLLFQAIQLAGGALPEADLARVNLVSEVKHGQKLSIPYKPSALSAYHNSAGPLSPEAEQGEALVNINQSSTPELARVKGIGPALARRIVEYRNANGFFASLEDLKKVKGVGPKTYIKLEKLISI